MEGFIGPELPRKERLRVLSLGAGVQSSTVLLMSLYGHLPPLDAAIFADTGWEPRAVYAHLDYLASECRRGGVVKIDIMNPAEFGLTRFLFVLEGAGLIDERNYRGLCGANGLNPDASGMRKSVYAALAHQFLASDDEGAKSLKELLALAERTIERDLDRS